MSHLHGPSLEDKVTDSLGTPPTPFHPSHPVWLLVITAAPAAWLPPAEQSSVDNLGRHLCKPPATPGTEVLLM